MPRPDGVILADSPELLLKYGEISLVPFVIGDQEGERTIFVVAPRNMTTTEQLVQYRNQNIFQQSDIGTIERLVHTYPNRSSAGSPFRTRSHYELYPQFKRLVALLRDVEFTLQRRLFLHEARRIAPNITSWSYLASYNYSVPVLGTFHGSDLNATFSKGLDSSSRSIEE